MIGAASKVIYLQGGIFLRLSLSQLVNAVVPCHLGEPGAERHHLIPLIQHSVEFQEDLSGSILGVFPLAKISPANLQNVTIVRRVTFSQRFAADRLWLVQGSAKLRVTER
jgi:hypothetical protein